MTPRPVLFSDLAEATEFILAQCPSAIRMATPLGLGKPHRLINALYDRVVLTPERPLNIYTALSLNPPEGQSTLEKRFLEPFTERLYGAAFPRLHYVDDRVQGRLPKHIRIEEFYMQSGALLQTPSAQAHYASLNYTRVPKALAQRDLNLILQKIASNGSGRYSLSCNTDLTQDTLDEIERLGLPRPLVIGEIDPQLPYLAGTAEVDADFFDAIVEPPAPYPPLFALPRQPVTDADYAIGFFASTLVPDGGTIQIGIGALADGLSYALILRHTDNATYRAILNALDPTLSQHPLVQQEGGLEPFQIGLYGCSEMVNEGFRALVQHGVVKRRVVEDVTLQRKLIEGTASAQEREWAEQTGQYLHGAFYLGSPAFYDWVRQQAMQPNTIGMQRVSLINDISSTAFERERLQRYRARFFNTCMMASYLGGAASETLADGRVVSGVGGQYNFVSMGQLLPDARSILMLRASRTSGAERKSNILSSVENLTIPRHLRDIYITEYGIADLRDAVDADCIQAMLRITDQQFQSSLFDQALHAGKLLPNATPPTTSGNTPAKLHDALRPFRLRGQLPDYPLGSDFTPVEARLVKALAWLKANTITKGDKARTLLQTALHHFTEGEDLLDHQAALQRMELDQPSTLEEKILAKMLEEALRQTD